MTAQLRGWPLLHSPLPKAALKPLHASVYNVSGLTDVNEGYLIERLHQSGLEWSFKPVSMEYLGTFTKVEGNPKRERVYHQASFLGTLEIETAPGSGRFLSFAGAGASDNVRIDAAFKGAKTTAFKNGCKEAGLTAELYKGGVMKDTFEDVVPEEVTNPVARENAAAALAAPPSPTPSPQGVQEPSNDPAERRNQILAFLHSSVPEDSEARQKAGAAYKAAEARKKGSGFDAAFTALEALHERHHGASCEHIQTAFDMVNHLDEPVAA